VQSKTREEEEEEEEEEERAEGQIFLQSSNH
jgi:hypothetical protein